jgi:CHAD domain-containing protein
MTNATKNDVESLIIGAMMREYLRAAVDDIASADLVVRQHREEGLADNPEAIRKLRLSFRRVQYQLATMAKIEKSLTTKTLIRRLHDVGKPFGDLRDAEVLELRVIKGLGERAQTPKGLQLKKIAADARRLEQLATETLIDSRAYHETLEALNEYRRALPTRNISPTMIQPIAQRVLQTSWKRLRREVKRAKRNGSDANLHYLRITAKRALYSTQIFSNVLGPPAEDYAHRVDLLQKFLGKQHDQVLASAWAKDVGRLHPPLRKLASEFAKDERKRANANAKRWNPYWESVEELQPRQLWRGERRVRAHFSKGRMSS